jgi:hypothetical protein
MMWGTDTFNWPGWARKLICPELGCDLKSSQAFETRCGELEKVDANASRVEEASSVSITELFGEKATL